MGTYVSLQTLVHFSWDRSNGWRCSKRPGCDIFLDYVASYGVSATSNIDPQPPCHHLECTKIRNVHR